MPSTRIRQNIIYISIFTVISLSGLLWLAINTGQRFGPLPPAYRVSFGVRDADGLVDGDDVRIAGIPVGKVLLVQTTARGAMVTMGIDPKYSPIYSDATVLIRPKSLLGEKYVDMQKGASNVAVTDGGSIPATQAASQVEVDQVLNNSDPETRKALSVDLQALGQGLDGRGKDLNATLPELQKIAEHLSNVSARFKDRTAQIDHILVDTDIILSTLADEHAQLARLLQSADGVTATIAANNDHLAGLINGSSSTIARLNTAYALQNNDQNIRTATELAPPTLNHTVTFLDLISHKLNTVVPSLLLGNQYNYPNDQLTVAQQYGIQLSQAWDSGFRMYSPSKAFGLHGFTALSLTCKDASKPTDPKGTYPEAGDATYPNPCPEVYENGGGYGSVPGGASSNAGTSASPAARASSASPSSSTPSSAGPATPDTDSPAAADAQRALLQYLLGQ